MPGETVHSRKKLLRIAGQALAAVALAVSLSACAPSALSTARSQIAAANYPAARQELVALSARTDLNESQRREVKDDLCLVDFKIGRPTYTLAEQRGVVRQQIYDETAATTDLRRLPEPGEVADAVVFLASSMARAITGQCLDVNSGEYHH